MSGYIGVQPVPKATQRREYFTATNGQTSFSTSGYTPEYIDVYMNGVKLSPADFTATNGSDVVLGSGAATGDLLQIISFLPFSVLNQAFSGTLSVAGALTAASGTLSGALGVTQTGSVSTVPLSVHSNLNSGQAILELRSTGNSNSIIDLRADGTGDSKIYFDLNGVTPFSIGVDNSDGDKFKISGSNQLGTNTRLIIDASGNLGINATPTQKLHVGGNAIITGLTRLGNGTESSPAYQFVDDTNTGMYRSSSDVLGFSTGGTNRLTLNSTGATFAGNVGLGGTPATNTKLLVKAGTNLNLEVENSSSNLRLSALNDARSANVGMQFASSGFEFLTGATTFNNNVAISSSSGDTLTLTKSTTEPSLRIEGDANKDFVFTVSGELLTLTQNDGATDIVTFDHDTKAATFAGTVTAPTYIMTGGSQIGQDFAYLKSNSTSTASLTLRKDASGADSIDYLQLRNDGNGLIAKINGAGAIGAGDGAAALPSLTFANDPNTGLYRSASDNLGFAIGGTARAFMSNSQFNVATKIVATELDINGNGDVSGNLLVADRLLVNGATSNAQISSKGKTNLRAMNVQVAVDGHIGIGFFNTAGTDVGGIGINSGGASISLGGNATANHLDDYEEGSWTPTINFQNSTNNAAASVNAAHGRYTKVGNVVTFTVRVNIVVPSNLATDNFTILGLPYASHNIASMDHVFSPMISGISTDTPIVFFLQPNQTSLFLSNIQGNGNGGVLLTSGNAVEINVSGSYRTN